MPNIILLIPEKPYGLFINTGEEKKGVTAHMKESTSAILVILNDYLVANPDLFDRGYS